MEKLEQRIRKSAELSEQVETAKPIFQMHDRSSEAYPVRKR